MHHLLLLSDLNLCDTSLFFVKGDQAVHVMHREKGT